MPTLQCHNCGAPVAVDEPIPRDSECENCRTDYRCCLNCRHYDTAYNNSCRETEADPVPDKKRRNFCEFFSFSRKAFVSGAGSTRADDARKKLEAMFGGGAATSRDADARKKLEGLFRKKEDGAE